MTNSEIAKLLRHVAAAYVIKNESKFRFQIIAYQKAADAIEASTTEVKQLIQENKLEALPGIGPSIKQHLEELIQTGSVRHFQDILNEIPSAMLPLLDIPSFGPKKSYKLVSHFKLSNPKTVITDLEQLAQAGKIADLEGFGEKSQADIINAINSYKQGLTKTIRMTLPFASAIAEKLLAYIKESPEVIEAYPLGSLRRKRDSIGDVDIAVSTTNPKAVIEHFVSYPYQERVLEQGDITAGLLIAGGKHIDLMTMEPDKFGSLLQHFTGSKNHNIHLREYALKKNLSLSERGIKQQADGKLQTFKTEEAFYNALGMQWIPPELREDMGEIELALKNSLPKLVELSDIKGDFHLHSNFPIEPSHDMGQSSMEEMIQKALSLRYTYLAFSEHNPSQSKHTDKQTREILQKRIKEIDRLRLKYKKSIRIFSSLEVDILPNGSLAVNYEDTQYLDFMLVSIHSVFAMDKEKMTNRILKALSHPKAKILTHPSGRLINQRSGYELDWDKLFTFCASHHKAIEINAYPERLDLADTLVRRAIAAGVRLVIDTDSHAAEQMDLMQYGVSVARRGWATRHDILNTMEYNKLEEWIKGG